MSEPVIDIDLVRRLVAAQFPHWAGLPLTEASPQGWDNRSFRLGDELVARLPSAERYLPQVEKERAWLPKLGRRLPVPIPQPVAEGAPGEGYPFPWNINRWIEGRAASVEADGNSAELASDLARFLRALYAIPASDGPPAGAHNFHRGGDLKVYDDEVRRFSRQLSDRFDRRLLLSIWDAALATAWQHAPVWVHGDFAAGNLLIGPQGRLAAVIDWGSSGVGDPASDLVVAWTLLGDEARAAFRLGMALDADTWARGRAWALWKALHTLAEAMPQADTQETTLRRIIAEVTG